MHKERIVISGLGVVSAIGIGKERFWEGLAQGKSAQAEIDLFDVSQLKVKEAAQIKDFCPADYIEEKFLRTFDRATRLLVSSAKITLEDACLKITQENTRSIGVSIGTTFGSLNSISEFDKVSVSEGPRYVNPAVFANTVINAPASQISIHFHIKGFNATVSSGMCASLDALEYACDFLQLGRIEKVLAGGVEEFCVQTFLGFYKLGYLSGLQTGKVLSCPFDKRRDGIVVGEGAANFLLETLASAKERNAFVYAQILSIGSSFSAYRINKYSPKAEGMQEAMRLALRESNLRPQDIDCIFANANSTPDADKLETEAIKQVFGRYAKKIPVTSIKSMLGETFSASGALAVAAGIGSIQKNFIPPTINYQQKDPELDLDYVTEYPRQKKINTVMINTFSQNGANKSIILGRVS